MQACDKFATLWAVVWLWTRRVVASYVKVLLVLVWSAGLDRGRWSMVISCRDVQMACTLVGISGID